MYLQWVGRCVRSIIRTRCVADLHRQPIDLAMRQLEKFVEQAELVHELERRRMHGIAAEIAEKVRVLFQHHHANARARQKKAKHHSGRSAARDAACVVVTLFVMV